MFIKHIKKFLTIIRLRGISNTIKIIFYKILFEGKCFLTLLKLNLLKQFRGKNLIVTHGQYRFKYHGGGDRGEILYHAFWNKMFINEKEKVKRYIKEGDTVIDVGANMGFFVLILNELVGKRGIIYSFEPSNRLKERLKETIEINNLKNVIIVNSALGDSEGKTKLYFNPKQTGLSSIVTNFKGNSLTEEVQITTLDNFFENIHERISFIKIDTEGYEPQVLNGARKLIKRNKPIIYIELGGDYQKSSAEALNILKELNYNCEAEYLDLKNVAAGTNFIATPKI